MLRESLSEVKKKINKIKRIKKKNGGERKRKNASPPNQFMHLVPTFSTNSRGNTCYIRATQFLCWLKVQTFVSWFSDPLLAHLRLWLKRKIERCFSFTLLALVFHWRLSWKFGGLRFFEERETDQRFFSLVYLLGKQQTFANNKWLETDIIFVVQGSEEVCCTA